MSPNYLSLHCRSQCLYCRAREIIRLDAKITNRSHHLQPYYFSIIITSLSTLCYSSSVPLHPHTTTLLWCFQGARNGWTQFTEGLITPQWAELQHNYYNWIGVKNNGKVWAANLLSQLWDLNFHVWNSRNAQLHSNSSFLNQLHGEGYLDIAIEKEFCHGKGNLPSTFSPFFSKKKITQLKSLPIESKLKWFKTIRTAREDIGSNSITDEFTTNRALRKWADLRPP
jgi:hypothetical protein